MKKFAVIKNGKVNQRLVFDTLEKALNKVIENDECVLPVWEFFLWYRSHDDKDFIRFYSAKKNIDEAVDEAISEMKTSFAIDNDEFGVVAKYGEKTEQFKKQIKNLSQC